MENRKFIILASKKQTVQQQLEKMNKRSLRLKLEEISWSFGKSVVNEKGLLTLEVSVSGPIFVQFENWEFAATLQHLPTGENIVRSIIENDLIPPQYRTNGSICEHCKVNRYRKDTYVVRNITNGKYVQVGSSCIKDFLGGNSPDNILARANLASEIISFISNSEWFGVQTEPTYFLADFLAKTSAYISVYGWLSKSKAYESGGKSTVSRIQDCLSGNSNPIDISEADLKKAEDAILWAESLSDLEVEESDYLYNIRAIARSGLVEWRTMGFAASIIPAYDKSSSKKINIVSNYVGALKSREVFTLLLKSKYEYVGSYGTTYKYIFNDEFGNVIIWKASNPQDFIINQKYLVKGTIKAHSEYNNIKQTEINRCEILCDLGE